MKNKPGLTRYGIGEHATQRNTEIQKRYCRQSLLQQFLTMGVPAGQNSPPTSSGQRKLNLEV